MKENNYFTLINPQTGNLAFKLHFFENENPFDTIQRLNLYSVIWVKEGAGSVRADFSDYTINANGLFSFSLYQPFLFKAEKHLSGVALYFHPDFFCIHKHHKEVACNGVLFNNIYSSPSIKIDSNTELNFNMLIKQLKLEMQNPALAQYELLVSYLKILLITASRLKTEQQDAENIETNKHDEPFILQNLKNFIEIHYKTKHTASEYANMLAITPKALNKLTKTHFNKTLTELIGERIVIEAKRELYLTNKSIKEIAYELGYNDEYYFSRFFKKHVNISPQFYRETIGFDRASSV
ncbi:helix-turn-helix domain-containing protein [Galbibacter orientalis]|uniref:helix-turn-helix domain-containing protein n=1 Tax=Galbibacter orientalis TaxID=453852 RepID=UPI003080D655